MSVSWDPWFRYCQLCEKAASEESADEQDRLLLRARSLLGKIAKNDLAAIWGLGSPVAITEADW